MLFHLLLFDSDVPIEASFERDEPVNGAVSECNSE